MIAIGLGSNLGNRMGYLRKALDQLIADPQIQILSLSSLYRSEAMLPEGSEEKRGADFLNAALLCKTSYSPLELLGRLKRIEENVGRKKRERWAAREIDLDLLWSDQGEYLSPELSIPHPGLLSRPFALLPLYDLLEHNSSLGELFRVQAKAWRLKARFWSVG